MSAFTNNTLSTLMTLDNSQPDKTTTIFIEGSVAKEPCFYKRFKQEMEERCADAEHFARHELTCPARTAGESMESNGKTLPVRLLRAMQAAWRTLQSRSSRAGSTMQQSERLNPLEGVEKTLKKGLDL